MRWLAPALFLLVATTSAQASVDVGAGLASSFRTGGGQGGLGTLTASWRFTDSLAVDFTGASGAFRNPGDVFLGLTLGARWTPTTFGRVEPSLFAGLAHAHETSFSEFTSSPGTTVAGVCDCIEHRTGIAAGFGFAGPIVGQLRWVARTDVVALLPHETRTSVRLVTGGGLAWRFE